MRSLQAVCQNHNKQIALACTLYLGDSQDRLPPAINWGKAWGTVYQLPGAIDWLPLLKRHRLGRIWPPRLSLRATSNYASWLKLLPSYRSAGRLG